MKLAFIGAGNMAQAMIGGVLRKGLLPKNEIIATAATQKTIDTVAAQYGVNVTLDNKEAAKADIIVLAVKPVYYAEVIAEIKDVVSSEQIIVTIAAGKSVAWVEEAFGGSHKIVRTMPNTPVFDTISCPTLSLMNIFFLLGCAYHASVPLITCIGPFLSLLHNQ